MMETLNLRRDPWKASCYHEPQRDVAIPPEDVQVLVVDDEAAIRRLVASILRRSGYSVDTAEDGVEAVLKIGLAEYHVIILDLMMPNLDGFEFLRILSLEKPEILERILVTSAASPQVIAARMPGVPFTLLPKPFELPELLRRVASIVSRSE